MCMHACMYITVLTIVLLFLLNLHPAGHSAVTPAATTEDGIRYCPAPNRAQGPVLNSSDSETHWSPAIPGIPSPTVAMVK